MNINQVFDKYRAHYGPLTMKIWSDEKQYLYFLARDQYLDVQKIEDTPTDLAWLGENYTFEKWALETSMIPILKKIRPIS